MFRKLAIVAIMAGLAPVGARAASNTPYLSLSAPAGGAPGAPGIPADPLNGAIAQATQPAAEPGTQTENVTPQLDHYAEPGAATPAILPGSEAAKPWGGQHGDWELTIGGTGSSDSDLGEGTWGVNFSAGYFFNPNWEVSLRQRGNFISSHSRSDWTGATLGAIDYNMLWFGRFVPFVGINGGGIYGQGRQVSAVFSGEGGLKFFLTHKTFIQAMCDYEWPTNFSFLHAGQFNWTLGIGIDF